MVGVSVRDGRDDVLALAVYLPFKPRRALIAFLIVRKAVESAMGLPAAFRR